MPPTELTSRLAVVITNWHSEFETREKGLETHYDTISLRQRMAEEEAQIDKSLHETCEKFDALLELLDKEHVVMRSGENLNQENYPKIEELSQIIYEEAMLALRLQRDFDAFRKLKGIEAPSDSLKRKARLHFILAEYYIATGIRTDPFIKDMSARAEYEKVINEGKELYDILKEQGNGILTRARTAHDIAASYKRLFDLFEESDKSDVYGYMIKENTEIRIHPWIKEARRWYYIMFDISHELEGRFEAKDIFHTNYEFKRYLRDIEELEVGCTFQQYTVDKSQQVKREGIGLEPLKYFECFKTGETCKHRNGNKCRHLEGQREQENALIRVEVVRNLF
jgi:hypothetical protein